MNLNNSRQAFFALLNAGLWEKEVRLAQYGDIDFKAIYHLANEQQVVGLVAAGLEMVADCKVPEEAVIPFGGDILKWEHQNRNMYRYTAKLFSVLQENGVDALLVKGPGIAECYEKPLWRVSGDLDLLLDASNYERAKEVLIPLAKKVGREDMALKHLDLTIGGGVIELHGTLHTRLSKKIDRAVDDAQADCFQNHKVRTIRCAETDIPLPDLDNDILFVFTHILHHFFIEGVGLRQICDWCRMLYTFTPTSSTQGGTEGYSGDQGTAYIDRALLERRLKQLGLLSEWKAFAALAVCWLEMPAEAMPLYDKRYKAKGDRIMKLVLASGNFGHKALPKRSRNYWLGKLQAIGRNILRFARIARIFPCDSPKFLCHYISDGIKLIIRERLGGDSCCRR